MEDKDVSRETTHIPLRTLNIAVSLRSVDALDAGAQELYSLAEGVHYAGYETPEEAEDARQNFTELGRELERLADTINNLLSKEQ